MMRILRSQKDRSLQTALGAWNLSLMKQSSPIPSFFKFALAFVCFFSLVFAEDTPMSETITTITPESDESLTAAFFSRIPSSAKAMTPSSSDTSGYTINYNTVPIIEYIRFASKICNINFLFNEADLNFTVTVVSEGPITADNVMATLVQILRIHDLQLLEQGNNLVIHRNDDVKQMATLFSDKNAMGAGNAKSPIVTRIFRLQNIKTDSMAAIIKPMISKNAILETSLETRQIILTDVTANVDKVALLIENLDTSNTLFEIKSFEVVYNKSDYLIPIASQLMAPLTQGNPFILVPASLSNVIFVVSTPELTDRALQILASLDVPPKKSVISERKLRSENIFVYKLEHRTGEDVLSGLGHIADNLEHSGVPETDLLDTIDTAKWIRETNAIMIVGSKESVEKVKELIASLDVPSAESFQKSNFFVYKPLNRPASEVYSSIREMAQNLKGSVGSDPLLISTIESAKINSATETITFSGEEKTFSRIKELLSTIDVARPVRTFSKNNFFIYQIKSSSATQLDTALRTFAKNLDKSNADNESLSKMIEGMKYIKETNSILFSGPDTALKRLQEILPTFDADAVPLNTKFFVYRPKYQNGGQLASSLKDVADNLKSNDLSDPNMLHTLESMKWVKSTNSLLFTGDPDTLQKLEALIATLDSPSASKGGYYVYKLQNASGKSIEEGLDQFAQELKQSGTNNPNLFDSIEHVRYIKETNSLLITGDPATIDAMKDIIARYDMAGAKTDHFMYKPQNATADQIETALRDIAAKLQSSGLADSALLSTIQSMQYSDASQTLLFTGTPDALTKLQAMLKEIDVPPSKHAAIQKVGQTTYLVYKIKNASSAQITASLKAIVSDLKKSGKTDKDFMAALNSMKYVRDSNSLIFTGTADALSKVESLVEKFDVTGQTAPTVAEAIKTVTATSNFYVYKPQSLTGPELEKVMQDFAGHLRQTGLSDPDLLNTITTMRWVDKTSSLLFTGTPKSIEQVKELLREFDIPANLPGGAMAGSGEATIQSIDNTGFLVYKLQFHKGEEIQNALRQIAKDLTLSNAPVNQSLLNSINSVQWLEVTNSLLCSGDSETLTRLRELIKNLDVPLKQVFIEMLVLQTSLTNALTFGLEWGARYKYQNKFSGTINNLGIPSGTGNTVNNSDILNTALLGLDAVTTPTPKIVPILGPGFDLGVIGEVIRHGGDTFLTLGSLLAALQLDSEATVVMTPKLLTQDGRTSTIFQGNNVPFAGSFVSNSSPSGTGGTIGTTNIEYRDIGMSLTITPVLGNSDIVTLDINLDQTSTGQLNAAQNQITFTNTGVPQAINGITTSKTTMQTTVHVPDNHFLILSGMVNSSTTKTKTGMPCLGGLPFIGALFSRDDTSINNSNIVIFLRPHIVNSLDDITRITHDQEVFFQEQAGTPFLEHSYNEAMELIKTVDDE